MIRIGKSIETESGLVVIRGQGGWEQSGVTVDGVSFGGNENVLELESLW